MKFVDFLKESFDKNQSYGHTLRKSGRDFIYDITTEEDNDYRLSIRYYKDKIYIASFGYKAPQLKVVNTVKDDLYDVNKIISTITELFLDLRNQNTVESVVYTFDDVVDAGYRLLILSIFKNELSQYYKIEKLKDESTDYNSKDFIVVSKKGTNNEF